MLVLHYYEEYKLSGIEMDKKIIFTTIIGILIISSFLVIQFLVINELETKRGLSFTDEDVIITANSTIAQVYARYGMHNYGELTSYWIILPFASRPWGINLTLDNNPLEYSWTTSTVQPETEIFDAITFRVDIPEDEYANIIVSYYRNYEIQEIEGEQKIVFRYIVGSTRSWHEPLNYAHFEFWFKENNEKSLIDSRDYYDWLPEVTFLYFEYQI